MPNYFYYQGSNKNEQWNPVPVAMRDSTLTAKKAVFCTALSVSKLADNLEAAEKAKLAYEGPFYLDWDSLDIAKSIEKINVVLDKFREMEIDLRSIAFFATGQKGFHAEIPTKIFMDKPAKGGVVGLPLIYKEMVFELAVDTLDLRVYSQGRGRMWRLPNVKRPDNGFYKVPVTVDEIRAMTPELYAELIKAPRMAIPLTPPEFNIGLHIMFAEARQKIESRLKDAASRKPDPQAKKKARMPSVLLMMKNVGLRPDAGFHQIAMQIAIAAITAGMTPDEMIANCADLIANHQSDGNRYNTPGRRKEELLRLYDYMLDNPGYAFSIGAIKSILVHGAPDLDGLPVSEADVAADIVTAAATYSSDLDEVPDEYGDVAGGVTLSKYGVYVDTEHGKKRVCAVSFADIHLLHSMDTGALAAYEAEILVNGQSMGRQTMELDTFASTQVFNRFCYRVGHAFQGLEPQLRGLMMRFVEMGKKTGKVLYISKREGLDMVNLPYHTDEKLREPFMVYADASGVILDPRVADCKLDITFQGFPDPRGHFQTDLAAAPDLAVWIEDAANKEALRATLTGMFSMQKPEAISKMLGWYVACFYRMIFHKAYGKFPLLHINGPAGSGKTEMNTTMASFFYYNTEPKVMSPGSTMFALTQHMTASASVPLLIDEYKPNDMDPGFHNKIRLAFRDAYNCHDQTKGGGNRDSDDYRNLHHSQLAAPIVFIAEAAEEESAVAERIVLVTITKPSSSMAIRQLGHYNVLERGKQQLAILGQYLAGQAIRESGKKKLQEEFDPLFAEAKKKFLLNDADINSGLSADVMAAKQMSKERSVFNYTVALFGLKKFRAVIEDIFEQDFKEAFDGLEAGVYGRMSDLHAVTQPEWAKVMVQLADMSWNVDPMSPMAVRHGQEYALYEEGGRQLLEVPLRAAYHRYRQYATMHRSKMLFPGDSAFLHAMHDCPAVTKHGTGRLLPMPQVYTFSVDELRKAGVQDFKPGSAGRR